MPANHTTFKVQMLAFGKPGEVREVDVPDDQLADTKSAAQQLDLVFYFGQNDFQPKRHPSMSCGDVVELGGKSYLCCRVGFRLLTPAELDDYKKLDRRDRNFSDLLNESNVE